LSPAFAGLQSGACRRDRRLEGKHPPRRNPNRWQISRDSSFQKRASKARTKSGPPTLGVRLDSAAGPDRGHPARLGRIHAKAQRIPWAATMDGLAGASSPRQGRSTLGESLTPEGTKWHSSRATNLARCDILSHIGNCLLGCYCSYHTVNQSLSSRQQFWHGKSLSVVVK